MKIWLNRFKEKVKCHNREPDLSKPLSLNFNKFADKFLLMNQKQKETSTQVIKDVLRQYLLEKGFRNTPERYTILEEIYNMDHHFNVDDLYLLMMQKKYHVSKATIYNTIEIFLDAGLIRKHQFGEKP